MAETPSTHTMPADLAKTLKAAYRDFSAALDPSDPWANRRLASVIAAATAAGWSRRTTAAELGISRERALKISGYRPSLDIKVDRYRRGETFPASAVSAFNRIESRIADRRRSASTVMTALIRSAHSAGWPYQALGEIVGATGEWIRQIHEADLDTAWVTVPEFPAYCRPLKPQPEPRPKGTLGPEERKKMRELAVLARGATRTADHNPEELSPGQQERLKHAMAAREASEQLSAMIIDAKVRRITWSELDEACGYRTGGARARAVRHGYGKLPPTMTGYSAARGARETPAKKQLNV